MTDVLLQNQLHQLIELIQESDDQAFSDFYDLTINRIFGLVYKILGDPNDSEEVVSDAYAQIWQQANNYSPEKGSVLGWSLMIARCRALDLYRKRRNANQLKEDAQRSLEEGDGFEPPCDLALQITEANTSLQESLQKLSRIQRQLVALSFYKGMSHSEIAEATELPVGTVKSHIRRAILALQSIMKE